MRARASVELDARVNRAIERAIAERAENEAGGSVPHVMRILMKTRMTQWAATAATLAAVVLLITALYKSAPAAFAMERVVEAYNHVRSLHIKTFGTGRQAPNEFWIQSNGQGHVEKARYFLPQTEDGPKVITWTPERTELWFQRKRGYVRFQTRRIEGWMQSLLEQSQPQLFIKKLIDDQKAGKVDVQIREPRGESGVVITAVNTGARTKQVCQVDPKTELITRIESYRIEGGTEALQSRMEFSEYNVPFPAQFFELRGELPKDVRISDRLNQVAGLAQGGMTDEQAAVETVRQFFQALIDKDYKKAGLLVAGELEEFARAEYGQVNVTAIMSIGPAVAQPQWDKHGFKVPCEIEVLNKDGQKVLWKPGAYVRPGDDEMHPDYWNITGGVNAQDALISLLPDNDKYAKMTAKEAAAAFLKACAEENWNEFAKFSPYPVNDQRLERIKEYLGGLQVISIGEAYQSGEYPGWYVPYEIKLRQQELNVRVSNANGAKRYVLAGVYDGKLQVRDEVKWSAEPDVLAADDPAAKMSPVEVTKAYFAAAASFDWAEMRKFVPQADVAKARSEFEDAQKRGSDLRNLTPTVEVGEAFWSQEHSAWFVKCRVSQFKKWNLAVRNDNAANRFLWDGGI